MRRVIAALTLVASLGAPRVAHGDTPAYTEFVGALHNHSGYSDGWPGTTPATYYASGKSYGIDFLSGSEHSDNADIPITFSDGCLGPDIVKCPETDPDALRKWDATLEQANAASTLSYTGLRGFEWTSDRYGHINVYFSANDTNAKIDGGYATMDTFYKWFTTPPNLGGGADGLATFNHPGDKTLSVPNVGDVDPPSVQNWNDFTYVAAADDRMVGIEMFNDHRNYNAYYSRALDKGWHLGAVGAEDLHGIPGPGDRDKWGGPMWAKTVILATDRTPASLRAAMLARRFYAIGNNAPPRLHLSFTVDDELMGSRLVRHSNKPLDIVATTDRPNDTVEVVTSGGVVVASGLGSVQTKRHPSANEKYYFMRVIQDGKYVGYSSPVWVSRTAGPPVGEWLAGDLHVHTCYSHDAYCPPDDDNTGPDEFYTLSGSTDERFTEASLRGLDYLAITDHNRVDAQDDPGFGTHGVIGVPAYENSLDGHAQMLGADHIYPHGNTAADISEMADALRADGGVFQINHPADDLKQRLDATCGDTSHLDWGYGFGVVPDTLEVWNIGFYLQPPLPAGNSNDDSLRYWECWLDRGHHVGATGGSDSHWLSTSLIQGAGNPTTWVFVRDRTVAGILQGLREGRTSISVVPPLQGAVQLLLEADDDHDGVYESIVGDTVGPNTPMRVRAIGTFPPGGLVEVRANAETVVADKSLPPGGEVTFRGPSRPGWVRATLRLPDLDAERSAICDPVVGAETPYCRNRIAILALTSAIYVEHGPS